MDKVQFHRRRRALKRSDGQSLVEAVIVVGLMTVFAVGIVAATTSVWKASQAATRRSGATKYAQSGIEYFRSMVVRDPDRLSQFLGDVGVTKDWCLASDLTLSEMTGECPIAASEHYARKVSFTKQTTSIDVAIEVSWFESGSERKSVTFETKLIVP